jgi:hypothetical protein
MWYAVKPPRCRSSTAASTWCTSGSCSNTCPTPRGPWSRRPASAEPGGTVVLQDLDGQLLQHYPPDPTLQRQLESAIAGLGTTGFDPFVGRKLFALARAAGMSVRDLRVEPYHLIAGRADEHTRRLWSLKLDIAQPATARALGSRQEADALRNRLLAYLDREDTLTWSYLFTVWATPGEANTSQPRL